jgi:hypothetical protein
MRNSARVRVVLGVAVSAAVAVLGLAGCARTGSANAPAGGADNAAANSADTTDLSWDGQALESIGLNPTDIAPVADVTDLAAPQPSVGPTGKHGVRPGHRFKRMRFGFGGHLMHAEAVVQTEEGTKTVVVQRGTVTAVDATSVTVKSADGFIITWKLGDKLRVFAHRASATMSAVTVGEEIGIAGAKSGDTDTARLIIVPEKSK